MLTRLSKNLEQAMIDKQSSREQLHQLSSHSFITLDRISIKSKLQASFIIDQQNAKQLQQIQKKALLLKQKQKKQRSYLKRLKKLFQQQQKEFMQLKSVSKVALEQKSREIQLLTIELEGLKQEKYQFLVLTDEKQILVMKNQQLEEENKTLGKELAALEEKYRGLKVQFQQQAELLDKGIRYNEIQIQTQPSTASTHGNNQPTSLKQVQLLSRQLQQKRKKQLQQQELKKQQTNLKIQTDKMNNCNFMLESLLKQIKKQQKQRESQSSGFQTKIQRSQLKLITLTDQLMKKTHELSEVFGDLHRLEKQMRQKQRFLEAKDSIIQDLNQQIKQQQINLNTKLEQIYNYKQQIQIYHDLEKMRDQQEKQVKVKRSKNYERFQQQIQKLFQDKLLKEHSSVYQVFENITKEIFSSYNIYQISTSSLSSDITSQKFIQNVLKLIQKNLLKLNDYFRLKAQKQVQRIHKMVGMMKNANDIIHKNQDQYEKERENDMFNASSPQRFNYMGIENENIGIMGSMSHHRRQESESSAHSKKKSIVLEEDLDGAVNLEQELDSIKEQALQKEFADLKASQVLMIDSLNDPTGIQQSRTITDAKSQSSFQKSKVSQLSSIQQQNHYNKNIQAAKMNAKLKKKKK